MADQRGTSWRFLVVMAILLLAVIALVSRLLYVNVIDRHFLLKQSKARIMRSVTIPAYRGIISDRLNVPLAISTPLQSIWLNPQIFKASDADFSNIMRQLQLNPVKTKQRIARAKKSHKEFMYLKRLNSPTLAKAVMDLHVTGVFSEREYKRFYPEGEVASQLVGLTNVDDQGQEGIELAYNRWLAGSPGKKEIIRDRLGRTVANVALLKNPVQGKNLALSIDHRIQYLAYRSLKEAVNKYHAQSGSVVVMDSQTGEVLAMVNQPSYNPNNRPSNTGGVYRNRALTDTFEPGSTMKPFTIALALKSGEYTPETTVDTNPGRMKVGGYEIKDDGLNYGVITLSEVLQKSSNIGAAKVMLTLSPQNFWRLLRDIGFGQRTQSGFPGEAPGTLVARSTWYPSVVAAMAYGYGIAVTTMQMAHAYQVLANLGQSVPVSLLKITDKPAKKRVLAEDVAQKILAMLQNVVEKGTGTRAQVPGYTVAGKTGTAYIAGPKGYDKQRFIASFVGVAPATRPRLVVAVMVRDPKGQHFGGLVSAPVFAKVMAGSLRLLNIPPDNLGSHQ